MPAYRALIFGVILLTIGGGGYYFKKAGVPDLVVQDIKDGGGGKSYGVSALEAYSGVYECTVKTGCITPTKIILSKDTSMDIISTVNEEEESLGQGVWKIGTGGAIVLMIQNGGPIPGTLITIRKINLIRLSELSSKSPLFEGMKNPIFNRIEPVDTKNQEGSN